MSNGRPPSDFLTTLLAALRVVSRETLSAFLKLSVGIAQGAKKAAIVLGKQITSLAKLTLRFYLRVEEIIVNALTIPLLAAWAAKVLLIWILVGVVLYHFEWTLALAAYAVFTGLALVLHFRLPKGAIAKELGDQEPLRALVSRYMRVLVRVASALLTIIPLLLPFTSYSSFSKEPFTRIFGRLVDGRTRVSESIAGDNTIRSAASASQPPSVPKTIHETRRASVDRSDLSIPPTTHGAASGQSAIMGIAPDPNAASRVLTYVFKGRVAEVNDNGRLIPTVLPLSYLYGTPVQMEVSVKADALNLWMKDKSIGWYPAQRAMVRIGANHPLIAGEPMNPFTVTVSPSNKYYGSTFGGNSNRSSCDDCLQVHTSFQLLNAPPGYLTSIAPPAKVDITAFGQGRLDRTIGLTFHKGPPTAPFSTIRAQVDSIEVR